MAYLLAVAYRSLSPSCWEVVLSFCTLLNSGFKKMCFDCDIVLAGKQKQIQCQQLPTQTHLARQVATALYHTIWLQPLTKCIFMKQGWSASQVTQPLWFVSFTDLYPESYHYCMLAETSMMPLTLSPGRGILCCIWQLKAVSMHAGFG